MKNLSYKAILFATVPLLLLGGCETFTEVDIPQAQLTGESVFQDAATAQAALADVYARMRESGVASGSPIGVTHLMANYCDDLDFYGTNVNFEQFSKHTIIPSSTYVANLWNLTYGQIYALNALIEGLEGSAAVTGDSRDRLMGEAHFLRAYLHFYLVNLYGDVPYITSTDYLANSIATRQSQTQIYEQITADLVMAEALLGDAYAGTSRVCPNKAAVQAMLARVYLYTGNWQASAQMATSVLENPLYTWETDLSLLFLKDSPEAIWSLHPGLAGQNTKDARTFAFSSGPPTKPALSQSLYNAFEPGDQRRALWVKTVTNSSGTWYQPFKYKKNLDTPESQEYSILLRLSEQYLIRAEARAMLGDINGAQDDLNMVRSRAALGQTTAATQSELLTAILQERRVELFTEGGHRWFDLKRTGNASAALSGIKPGWADTDLLLPLPENELLLNSNLLPQNPGY